MSGLTILMIVISQIIALIIRKLIKNIISNKKQGKTFKMPMILLIPGQIIYVLINKVIRIFNK